MIGSSILPGIISGGIVGILLGFVLGALIRPSIVDLLRTDSVGKVDQYYETHSIDSEVRNPRTDQKAMEIVVEETYEDTIGDSTVERTRSAQDKAITLAKRLADGDDTGVSQLEDSGESNPEIDSQINEVCDLLDIETESDSTSRKVDSIVMELRDRTNGGQSSDLQSKPDDDQRDGLKESSSDLRKEIAKDLEKDLGIDSDLVQALQKLETHPQEAKRHFKNAGETVGRYRAIEQAFGENDLKSEDFGRLREELDGIDGSVSRAISDLIDTIQQVEDVYEELEDAIDRRFSDTYVAPDDIDSFESDLSTREQISWLAREVDSGAIGPQYGAEAARRVADDPHLPAAATELADRLATPGEHSPEEIADAMQAVFDDLKEYDATASILETKDASIESLRAVTDRIDDRSADIQDPFGDVVRRHAQARLSDAEGFGEKNVLGKYAVKTELDGLEAILREIDRADPVDVSSSLRSTASNVESELSDLKRRRNQQSRFGRANVFVDHYIELAEQFYESGLDALESGKEVAASERFDAATDVVAHTHDMYEGDKKKLLARAAGIAD